MKKESQAAKRKRELSNIEAIGLAPEQLYAIRKLNGSRSIAGNRHRATLINEKFSTRTIEAVLFGRRFNPEILQASIYAAKEQLQKLSDTIKDIESVLNNRKVI
jgi:hypothetical protein